MNHNYQPSQFVIPAKAGIHRDACASGEMDSRLRGNDILFYSFIFLALCLLLTACGGGGGSRERVPADAPGYVNGKPVHPTIKIGPDYEVLGETYHPRYDPKYDETGLASWYGPNFHGKSTANGEEYNQWAMTAAHKTLPLPSMVKVTHMKTGKSIMVRVNDRGPFSEKRIIDLSRAAAEALGMVGEGIAPVRVQYLKPETEQYIAKLQLKKPKEWTEFDVANAQLDSTIDQSVRMDSVQMSELAPAAHPPVEPATKIPDHFAFNAPMPQESTVEARGVEMHEIGYSESPFSVLVSDANADEGDSEKPLGSVPFQRVSYKPPGTANSPPATASGGIKYFVQAGSFSQRVNADKLAGKLASLSAVDVSELSQDGRTLYRVRLGPTNNDAIALEMVDRLKEFGIQDARVMKE